MWLVERLPLLDAGVHESRLDFGRRVLHLVIDPAATTLGAVARRLDSLGYPPHPYRAGAMDDVRRRETRDHLVRIGVAGACAGNVMLIAFALYGGMINTMDSATEFALRGISFGLTVIALLGPGRVFLRGALAALRTGVMHMDLPVAIALVLGTAWGGVNTFRGTGEVYFESLAAVIFLLLIGRWLQHRQQRLAHAAMELLHTLAPSIARRIDPDTDAAREVPIEALVPGDLVELRAGDSVPADGVLRDGASTFDLSLLSGESRPVARTAGDRLHAGTVNVQQRVTMTIDAIGSETRLGRLMALVERCASERPPIVKLADRVAHWFVVVALALAALTFLGWWQLVPDGTVSAALEHAIALLIVTCPCALGLATPLALQVAIGRAAARGMLIKGGGALEALAHAGLIVFDKTGTLTEGRMRVTHWTGDDDAKPIVAAIEREIAHPVAAALADLAPADGARVVTESEHLAGRGVRASVDGHVWLIASATHARSALAEMPPWVNDAIERALAEGASPIVIARDGAVTAVAGVGDALHADAARTIDALRARGWTIAMLSGDHPEIVARVANALDIPAERAIGGAEPEAKTAFVRERVAEGGTVVMVGDGVNDAAALAAATVGIAVHGGAEASLAAADVFLREPGPAPIAATLDVSRHAFRVIRRNLAVSLGYNVVTATLAILGVINPLIAAILMPISSLTVVTLSFASRDRSTDAA